MATGKELASYGMGDPGMQRIIDEIAKGMAEASAGGLAPASPPTGTGAEELTPARRPLCPCDLEPFIDPACCVAGMCVRGS